jgi:hypothetical protein
VRRPRPGSDRPIPPDLPPVMRQLKVVQGGKAECRLPFGRACQSQNSATFLIARWDCSILHDELDPGRAKDPADGIFLNNAIGASPSEA